MILARHIAERRFGLTAPRSAIAPADLVDYLLHEATCAPELWHQKAYLARVVRIDPDRGLLEDGILPLAHALDTGEGDAAIMTVEADGTGSIYPVLYIRRGGRVEEHVLEASPLLDFTGAQWRGQLASALAPIVPSVAPDPATAQEPPPAPHDYG
jgi:hypothetical protein